MGPTELNENGTHERGYLIIPPSKITAFTGTPVKKNLKFWQVD